MSEVILSNIQIWRQKCKDGTMSVDDMRQAISSIRKERVGASETSAGSKVKKAAAAAKAAPIDSDAMINDLLAGL